MTKKAIITTQQVVRATTSAILDHRQREQEQQQQQQQDVGGDFPFPIHGRIVALNLSPGIVPEECERNKPTKNAISNISLLQPALTSHLEYRPDHPFLVPKESSLEKSTSYQTTTSPCSEEETTAAAKKRYTGLSIYLYPEYVPNHQRPAAASHNNYNNNNNGTSSSTSAAAHHFQMKRESNETVARTLHRLNISLTKRLKVGGRAQAAKMRLYYRQSQDSSSAEELRQEHSSSNNNNININNSDSLQNTTLIPHSIWKASCCEEKKKNTNCATNYCCCASPPKMEEWKDALQCSNLEVWNHAIHTTLVVRLQMAEFDTTWNFLVEANPPTICRVQTFEDFGSYLFVGVPIVVRTKAHFAHRVIVDWYVDGQQVKQDCPMYCPRNEDLGKEVAVLVTPISAYHDGSGQQEAYKFERTVEVRPENPIVALRHGWISDHNGAVGEPQKKEDHTTTQQQNHPMIRVMTWNVLADQNTFEGPDKLNAGFAAYLEPDVLRKKRRMPLLLYEIIAYGANLICLQEVDECVFQDLLEPVLEYFGYHGYFTRKTSEGNREGCAMFWKVDTLIPTSSGGNDDDDEGPKSYAVGDLISPTKSISSRKGGKTRGRRMEPTCRRIEKLFRRRPDLEQLMRTQLGHVVQVCSFKVLGKNKDKTTASAAAASAAAASAAAASAAAASAAAAYGNEERVIVVANTHLFYHENGSHIRMIQMHAICQILGRVVTANKSRSGNAAAMILCGDLNSSLERGAGRLLLERVVPANATGLRQDLNSFRWDDDDDDGEDDDGGNDDNNNNNNTGVDVEEDNNPKPDYNDDFPAIRIPDSFPILKSALDTEPEFTNFVVGTLQGNKIENIFYDNLDHVLIDQSLVCERSAPMPSIQDVCKHTAMPSPNLPSDHVSIVVDLKLLEKRAPKRESSA